ncbi:MAG: nucleotide exchange factor GrpE, partial [Clostridium sp.]|nr:nucleotide exchange factor GrpE [Clostridium sp.]
KEILPIMDTLEKSLEIETENVNEFKKGVSLTLDKFKESLNKLGIEEIDTSEKFDPNFHDAVMHEKNDDYGEKEISDVFLKGYKKDDKVIRYSVVKVVN